MLLVLLQFSLHADTVSVCSSGIFLRFRVEVLWVSEKKNVEKFLVLSNGNLIGSGDLRPIDEYLPRGLIESTCLLVLR